MFGKRYPLLDLVRDDNVLVRDAGVPASFDTAVEARSYLELMASGVFRLRGDLVRLAEQACLQSDSAPTEFYQQQCYVKALSRSVALGCEENSIHIRKQALECGIAAVHEALEAPAVLFEDPVDRAAMAVEIECIQIWFLITTCRETHQVTSDNFDALFAKAIDLAGKYIQSTAPTPGLQPKRAFSLEPGILPTVFLVAEKCRDPIIRRRAAALMREGCMQEAMWDGTPYATFANRLAEIEDSMAESMNESALRQTSAASRSAGSPHHVSEKARFSDTVLVCDSSKLEDARLICARYRHGSEGEIEITEHGVDLTGDEDYLHDIAYGWV